MNAPVYSELARKSMAISSTAPTGLPTELRADEVYGLPCSFAPRTADVRA